MGPDHELKAKNITKRSRVDVETSKDATNTTKPKPVRANPQTSQSTKKKKKLDHRFSQRTMPTCMTGTMSGSNKDRPSWFLPGVKPFDHKPRVMTDQQIENVIKAFEGARRDTVSLMQDGIPTVEAVEEARATIKKTMSLVKDHVHPSFKILASTAFEGTKAGPMPEDPALVMSFMADCQRQVTAALAGKVEGALSVLARSVQGPMAGKTENVGNSSAPVAEKEDDLSTDGSASSSPDDDDLTEDEEDNKHEPTSEIFSQEF